jgi:Tol biopolymer transport system component
VGRDGAVVELIDFVSANLYSSPMISPDARRVSLTSLGDPMSTLIVDLNRRVSSSLTPEPGADHFAVWTPRGDSLVISSDRAGVFDLYLKSADGGAARRLVASSQHKDVGSWSPDGRYLVYAEDDPETDWDIWLLDTQQEPPATRPLISTPFYEAHPMISLDGRWLAYVSNEEGGNNVYVERFPQLGGKVRVSPDGGNEPLWSPLGNELFFTTGCAGTPPPCDNTLWVVDVETEPALVLGRARILFVGSSNVSTGFGWPSFDVTPDAERFLIVRRGAPVETSVPWITLNWFEELKRRVPAGSN